MSDQPVAETSAYTINTRDEYLCPPAGSEPVIPAVERPQVYPLDRTATGIDRVYLLLVVSSSDISYPEYH
jgi:hypothetical protein